MNDLAHTLHHMIAKFQRRAALDASDCQALMDLPYELRTVEPNRYLVREGEKVHNSMLIVEGLAFRQKLTADGSRQILSVHIPGDFVDLEGALLRRADHNVQALTRCEIAVVPGNEIFELIKAHPRIAQAMWIDTLIDASIFREWIVNVGRRNARTRIAHLLCEFARRLEVAGLGSSMGYELPMTQEQLADATGLTAVHINRTLKQLASEGLIVRERRFVVIPDWKKLRHAAEFNESYLHLEQVAPLPEREMRLA